MALPTIKQKEPVIGWKIIKVEYKRPVWAIISLYDNQSVDPVKGLAKCSNDGHKRIPEEFCSCGWYAYKTPIQLAASPDKWIARVRMYGKVIDCETGYRAEKQDILEIWSPESNIGYTQEAISRLPGEFPTIKWHLPEKVEPIQLPPPVSNRPEIHVHYPGGDPYDILPKEFIDALQPGMRYQMQLPICKNQSYGAMLTVTVINDSLQLEFNDYTNQRIGHLRLTGSKYWWKS